jgi:hypothetical protein
VVGDHVSIIGGEMTEAPALPFSKREGKRRPGPGWVRARPAASWSSGSAQPVEVVAPDRYSTDLLLEYAAPVFPAEIVPGCVWIVRLQPPPAGGAWALELLALVERWLESARLPWANVLYGGRSYLIRASTEVAQFRTAAASARGLSAHVPS